MFLKTSMDVQNVMTCKETPGEEGLSGKTLCGSWSDLMEDFELLKRFLQWLYIKKINLKTADNYWFGLLPMLSDLLNIYTKTGGCCILG